MLLPKPNYQKMYNELRKEHADIKFKLEKLQNMLKHALRESEM